VNEFDKSGLSTSPLESALSDIQICKLLRAVCGEDSPQPLGQAQYILSALSVDPDGHDCVLCDVHERLAHHHLPSSCPKRFYRKGFYVRENTPARG